MKQKIFIQVDHDYTLQTAKIAKASSNYHL